MEQDDAYWQAVQNRDTNYDGIFYYGVLTTGIYCRPVCKTRLALRKNIRFFPDREAAQKAGLRACRKCKPDNIHGGIESVVYALCRYIETHADETIPLARIAVKSGYSAAHIQKAFIAIVGSSPKAWQASVRCQRLKDGLKQAANVTDAIYGAGYSSSSRVYEKLSSTIGMTPLQYRNGAEKISLYYASAVTRLGVTMIAATERGICFLQFSEEEQQLLAELCKEFPGAIILPMPDSALVQFREWIEALNLYLDQKKSLEHLPLDIRGTAFQMLVWRYLQTIPSAEVRSYTEVAKAIGKPKAVRAVASACASNRIAIAVPCHRVLRGDGQLAGYRWGVERKRMLLDSERIG